MIVSDVRNVHIIANVPALTAVKIFNDDLNASAGWRVFNQFKFLVSS